METTHFVVVAVVVHLRLDFLVNRIGKFSVFSQFHLKRQNISQGKFLSIVQLV